MAPEPILCMLAYKTNNVGLTLKSLAIKIDIETLVFRRLKFNDLWCLNKLLNSKVECFELLSLINFKSYK